MSLEKEPIYTKLESHDLEDDSPPRALLHEYKSVQTWKRRFYWLLGTSVISIVTTSFILLGIIFTQSTASQMGDVKLPFSPAEGHVSYVNKFLTDDPSSAKFMGEPRPELDEAWHDLLQGSVTKNYWK
ncbi:MAG: hypothetical protein Q9159_002251 [Coniocarpon cinnabarinum]